MVTPIVVPGEIDTTNGQATANTIEFFVPGVPAPGGSKRAIPNKRTGKIIVVDDCKRNKPWRDTVGFYARHEMGDRPLITEAICLYVTFYLPRPKSHYGTGRNANKLKPSAPMFHITKPDSTKLLRALEDALTGIIWRDDSQINTQRVSKEYCGGAYGDIDNKPGARVTIEPIQRGVQVKEEIS